MKKGVFIEVGVWIVCLVILFLSLRSLLYRGDAVLRHDNFLWGYPPFQFQAENLAAGHFPLWNPFSNGGEPFYMTPMHLRFWDPTALLVIAVGHYITNDGILLFNWTKLLQILITLFGAFLVLRRFAAHWTIRAFLVPVLLFSSLMLGPFEQDGVLNHFLWVPYIVYCLLRIILDRDYRWPSWLCLGALVGLNWSSYFFAGTWIFLLFFISGLLVFRRDLVTDVLRHCPRSRMAAAALIVALMAAPSAAILAESDSFLYPARASSVSGGSGVGVRDYSFVLRSGTFSRPWDFLQALSPGGTPRFAFYHYWGDPSEAFIYLGLIAWVLGLVGMFLGRDGLKEAWLVVCLGFFLLMLGPLGGLHRILFEIYPPLWFVRHTHCFVQLFEFSFLYFSVLGANRIFKALVQEAGPRD